MKIALFFASVASFAQAIVTGGSAVIPPSAPLASLQIANGSSFTSASGIIISPLTTNPFIPSGNINTPVNTNIYSQLQGTQVYDSSSKLNFGFTAQYAWSPCNITQSPQPGRALYGGGTNSKITISCDNNTILSFGGGQIIAHNLGMFCGAPGDCASESKSIWCNAEVISGSESVCGNTVVNRYGQMDALMKTTLTGNAVRSGCPANMTFGQSVTPSTTSQSVLVSSTTGCATNDWLVAGYTGATGTPNWDPFQITVVDGTHISGVFVANHSNGDAIGIAVQIPVTAVCGFSHSGCFGQHQWIVNLSGTGYSTGTATITGGASVVVSGSGTAWTAGIVGGTAVAPGCFAFTGDDQTYSPFGAGSSALRSWFPIVPNSITGNTTLSIFSYTVPGSGNYVGAGTGGSVTYQILPCAPILTYSGTTLILAPNTFTWSSGNTIEQRNAPDIDSTGTNQFVHFFTPSSVARTLWNVANDGGQQVTSIIQAQNIMVGNTAFGNPSAYHAIIYLYPSNPNANAVVDTIIDGSVGLVKSSSFLLPDPASTNQGIVDILWKNTPIAVGPTVGGGFHISGLPTSAGAGGLYVCEDSSGNMYRKASCP